ncbi:MAG: hypothetical protein B6I36_10350 [Desulfobacteraceae bacterium 4572_35.1]|nr:MAG: hypothetical protein B6I36_10350 [Desulfobacteraceae bacterium 4572_35.1]
MSHKPFLLYKNVFDSTTTATDTEADGDYDSAYVSDSRPYTRWLAASSGTKYLTVDAGTATMADTLSILGHNLSGATVSVESSTTGAWGGEEVERLAGFVPANDYIIIKKTTEATARYWRVKIVASSAPFVAVLMLGARLDFPLFPDAPFVPEVQTINAEANISKTGHLLGVDVNYTPLKLDVSFTWPEMTFIEGIFDDFWTSHGRLVKPFIWVPNIEEWPDRAYLVRFPQNFKYSYQLNDTTNAEALKLSFEGVVE